MSGQQPQSQPPHKVDWLRTTAGAMAAMASAVLLSKLGAAGTLIGAALGSVIISVATSVFSSGLARGRRRVADVQEAALRQMGVAQAEIRRASRRTGQSEAHLEHADDVLAHAKEDLAQPEPSWRDRLADISWPRVAAYAGGLFAVVLILITAFELITGEPVSSLTGGTRGPGTSITRLGGGGGGSHPSTPTPTVQTPTSTPTQQPTAAPTTSTPTPTVTPTEATPTPTDTTTPTESPTPEVSPSATPTP